MHLDQVMCPFRCWRVCCEDSQQTRQKLHEDGLIRPKHVGVLINLV